MRVDERTDKTKPLRSGYERPNISIDRISVYGLALTAFLQRISEEVALHAFNMDWQPDCAPYEFAYDDYRLDFIGNYGNAYRCDAFTIHCYDWDESWQDEAWDDERDDFKPGYLDPNSDCYLDVESGAAVSWYKYLPRDICVNDAMMRMLDDDRISDLLSRAVVSMHKLENDRIEVIQEGR